MVKKKIERTCIICRNHVTPEQAIRLVVSPDGELCYDLKENLPARGYWLTASKGCLETLLNNPKRLKQIKAVKVSERFYDRLKAGLENQILHQLGLARRAGQLIFGFEKVKIWLKNNKPALALIAEDGSSAEISRLGLERYGVSAFQLLSKEQLGRALGRDHIVHIVIKNGRLAESISKDCRRLAGFLTN